MRTLAIILFFALAFGAPVRADANDMQRALHGDASKAASGKHYDVACKMFCALLIIDADDSKALKGLTRNAYKLATQLESKEKAAQWCRAVLFIDDGNNASRLLLQRVSGLTTAAAHDEAAKKFESENNSLGTYVELAEAERIQHDAERMSHMKYHAFSARLDLIKLAGITDEELAQLRAAAVRP